MDRAATSVFAFGGYLVLLGLTLLFVPNFLLTLFDLPPAADVWARVAGWAVFVLGFYYIQAARHNLRQFFSWTVVVRVAQFGVFAAFVLLQIAAPVFLAFSAFELTAGLWTLWALRGTNPAQSASA